MRTLKDFFHDILVSLISAGILAIPSILAKCGIWTTSVPIWQMLLAIGGFLLLYSIGKYCYKQYKIHQFIKKTTYGAFGKSRIYTWEWIKSESENSLYGYEPVFFKLKEYGTLDPNTTYYCCNEHSLDEYHLKVYLMYYFYDYVEGNKNSRHFLNKIHEFESHS